jgi:PAS domain S-box-containing protein
MPVVVMVNPGDEEIAAKALALGASSYVVKDEDHRYLVLLPNILAQARLTSRARYSQHHAPYEEVGEINDQLVKMQRVLEQKNAALEQERSRRQMISEMISDYAYALRVTPTGALETEWSIGPVKEITGYSESEIESVGGIKALIHADDIERTATWLDRVQAGETKHTEYRIRTKDGTVRWIKDWGRPEFDEDGKRVLRIYGAARDVTSRKLAEGELREREERFKALVQNSTDLITVVDAKGNITYASPSHQQVLGYSPAEMEGAPLASFAHPEDAAATAAAFEAVVQNAGVGAGTGVDIEVRVRHKDGSWRWLLSTMTNQLHNLAIEGIVVNCRHITDRKETEEALRASEQRLRRIIEANADAIIVVDAEGNIQMTNPAAEQLFGRPTDQLVDVPFGYPLAHGSRVEMDISTPDGRHVIAEMSAVEITWEGRPAFLASLRNVTRRTQMQRALEASEEKYRSLTENLPVAVYSADPIADTTVFASSQIEELTGYSREQFLEQPGIWQQMLHPDDRKRILSRVEACHAAAEPWDLEYRILTKQGDVRWVHDKGMPSSTSSLDAELFYDGFMEDITERKLTEEFLRRFRAALDSAGDAIFLFDPDARRFVDVNRTACEQLGYSRQELLKMQPEDFTLDVNTKDINNILRQTVGKDRLSVIEAVHQRKDGTTYPVEICIRSLPSEQAPSIIVASARDISERKRAEQALRESEERVRKIVEQSYDGIVLADPEGRIVVWNEGQEKIMGLSREEALGRYLWDVQYQMAIDERKEAPDSYQHVKDRIVKYLRDEEDPASSRLWEQKVQRPDGVELTVQSSSFSLRHKTARC